MKAVELQKAAGFSGNIMTRIRRNEYVSLESIEAICKVLETKIPIDLKTLPGVRKSLEKLNFFGEKFREKIESEVNSDINREQQLAAFTELFAIRNLIAHQTFVEFTSNKIRGKPFQDIMVLHRKAITEENLKEALRRLRYPVSEKVSKLYVQCFGNFEVLHYPSKRLWQLSVKRMIKSPI